MHPRAERGEIDGVPVFWAPAPGAFRVALQFRVGIADETLGTRGITHLVEHLALFAASTRPFDANGFVDLDRCAFYASGERAEVLDWLVRCAAALADPPLERLAVERRILRSEEAGRPGAGVQSRLLVQRLGWAGFGLAPSAELGLRWLGEDEVAAWARERFCRGNAGLWMTGPPPDELELPLLDGPRRPLPPVEPLAAVDGRRLVLEGSGGIALSGLARRGSAVSVGTSVAAERLYQRLRVELGMVYDPYALREEIGREHTHVVMGAGCPDERAKEVAQIVWEVASALGEGGVTDAELQRYRDRFDRFGDEPEAVQAVLDDAVTRHLEGRSERPMTEVQRELEALGPGDVADAMAAALESALLLLPAGAGGLDGFAPLEARPLEPTGGSVYAGLPEWGMQDWELRVGATAVTVVEAGSEPTTMRFEHVALAEEAPLGTLMLLAHDGTALRLCFPAYRDGDAARREVEARIEVPVIPIADIEQAEALHALARALPHSGSLAEELWALPRELGPYELPEALASYERESGRGLLALTNERLIQWSVARDEAVAWPRGSVRSITLRRRRLRSSTLVIDVEGADAPMELPVPEADDAEGFVSRFR